MHHVSSESSQSSESSSSSQSSSGSIADIKFIKVKSRGAVPFHLRVPKCDAPWAKMLSNNRLGVNSIHLPDSRDGRYFRRRFRIPFDLFSTLINIMLKEGWFLGFDGQGRGLLDATKREVMRGASLQVKVLSCLRILGRGVVFDECFDGSGCCESTIQAFFHLFTSRFVSRLFRCIVCPPENAAELQVHLDIYARLGLNGAFGSTDCTHVPLGKCPKNWTNLCVGKSGFPTLVYSMTCSHHRKIFHCTCGFAGSKNDKTVSKFDMFIDDVRTKPLYTEASWSLRTLTGVEERTGAYLICDGGYHKWCAGLLCCTMIVIPLQVRDDMRSQAHRVGCAHYLELPDGICPKGHRVLFWYFEDAVLHSKSTIAVCARAACISIPFSFVSFIFRYHSKNAPDFLTKMNNIVWSCCILHNLLLGIDGLDKLWTKDDYLSTWYFPSTLQCTLLTLQTTGTQILMPSIMQSLMFQQQRTLLSSSIALRAALASLTDQDSDLIFVPEFQVACHRMLRSRRSL
jgi:hypothetical protein